ncbi:D-2-hydroxyacid dehydrogenase [Paralimibaculum aggregatum]|uniref:D-2-hydroxyacid dehydrogenase n=1 Tax=Paralimibaculum aggregatum TaxID=3036245 RepID=A0ABQ6LM89_9RHOB|nr:D-2-hydroxyacid dehydrogenase [Limibaculum sp. NKW23]GMG84072.1 D-2-hydroxyacid dehydrogenase [Limibaculum sp. NKW23]
MSAAPVLIYAEEAAEIAAHLAARLPGERLLPVTGPAGLGAALAETPEIAFTIKARSLPEADHRRVLGAPSLRWFQVGGSGYEHVAGHWDPARVTVTNCVGVLAPFLAETCIGAIIALNNGLIAYRDRQKARRWEGILFRPIAGQVLVVVGAGAIGGELARRAAALGMRVIAIRRSGAPVPGAAEVRPPDALRASLAEADVVSVHLRLSPETAGMFGASLFAAMKPGAMFLNTARGGHVVEADLVAALASGQLRGAYLDVTETEPLPPESPLWDVPNLLISPHSADSVADWPLRFADLFTENLGRWRAGEPLRNVVAG